MTEAVSKHNKALVSNVDICIRHYPACGDQIMRNSHIRSEYRRPCTHTESPTHPVRRAPSFVAAYTRILLPSGSYRGSLATVA